MPLFKKSSAFFCALSTISSLYPRILKSFMGFLNMRQSTSSPGVLNIVFYNINKSNIYIVEDIN